MSSIESLIIENKAEAKQKRIETEKELKELYANFMTKKSLKEIIGIFPNFDMVHRYSLTNCVIAYEQSLVRNMSEYVGILNSFENWKKLGYFVKKGEKGLAIRVPAPKKITETDNESGEKKEKFEMHFKIGTTFDISQTNAFDDYKTRQQAREDKLYKNYDIDFETAQNYIKERFPDVEIKFDSTNKFPYYNFEDYSITLYKKSSSDLFHEIGHHITETILNLKYSHARNEILSEIKSYLFTKKFDSNLEFNFSYSNCWANNLPEEYPIKEFEKDFQKIADFIFKLN